MALSIAVALMTCDRPALTAVTVQSFAALNDLSRFTLLHGDDASADPLVGEIARQAGFQTVVQTRARKGIQAVRAALVSKAAARADWIVILENDIESVRPFPWDLFDLIRQRPEIYCLRLYGRFKDQDGREPCLRTHKRNGHAPVLWRPLCGAPEPSQVGVIHWSAQPAVTRSRELVDLHRTGVEPDGWTARVTTNVMVHIGVERTPGRRL